MKTSAALLVLGACLALPGSALAHRHATRAEKAAMMYHAGSHYHGLPAKSLDAPKAYPLRCAVADIATVVKGSKWGAWSFNGALAGNAQCARWASNGWVIEHKIAGKWYVVSEGDELSAHVRGVPHRIAVDLINGLS